MRMRTTLKCKWFSCHIVQRVQTFRAAPFNFVQSLPLAPRWRDRRQRADVTRLTIGISFQLDNTRIQSKFSHFCKVKTIDKLV